MENELLCPNCNHKLVSFQTDRQQTEHAEVILDWWICMQCRHVALRDWFYADEPVRTTGKKR